MAVVALATGCLFSLGWQAQAHAATPAAPAPVGGFNLQVSPSPLVATLKPGITTQLELKIHNSDNLATSLKIEPRSFGISSDSSQVHLDDTAPPDIASWISFSQPTFTVQPGAFFTEEVKLAVPKDAGFSYSFALVISHQSDPKPTSGGRLIKGSVAIFTLLNIDRPGAIRKIDIAQFSSTKHVYEYLPTTLNVALKNSGNTIVQPYGNIYIQRGETSQHPLATLAVNDAKGYILPNTTRTLSSQWSNGFPVYTTITNADGTTKQHLSWNWSKLGGFRIGKYTAQLVAVYNDGSHDIPITGTVSFWVIPWKILLGLLVIILLFLFAIFTIIRKIYRLIRPKKPKVVNPASPPVVK